MIHLEKEYKEKIVAALIEARKNYGGSNAEFANKWRINAAVYSRIKNGEIDGVLKDAHWLNIGRDLGVTLHERKWNVAKTEVFAMIERDVLFCQKHAKGMMCVDDCGIGKTFTAKYLSRTIPNCFYVDGSQSKTVTLLIKNIAKSIGADLKGTHAEIKSNIKYFLNNIANPVVIIDEAGDLNTAALLEIKEFWNSTEGTCGWYLMGAEGFKKVMDRGMNRKNPGYKELFSRFSERYTTTVPVTQQDKLSFYRKLISDVLSANMEDKTKLNEIVKRCLTVDTNGQIGGLRRAESLLILETNY